ncbi:unnamed protein product [Cylindrotheca closterium]|uniref:Domain of unknown function at the cortex 1 domain-containing protein n=1 Tax=Cylindrotheca closterium TaxID=2856 RepID=A0AAD2G848_9STRA|nr:unnamed protein product [Cylindrotheca closterium]
MVNSTAAMSETQTKPPRLVAEIFDNKWSKAKEMGEKDDAPFMPTKPNVFTRTVTEETLEESPVKKSESDITDDDVMLDYADSRTEEEEEEDNYHAAGEQQHAHPSLDALLLMDVDNDRRRIHPNGEVVRIDNEWLDMEMLIMLRTPDVDVDDDDDNDYDESGTVDKVTPRNQMLSKHFKGKQRRFEFQYQGKLKKKPDDKSFCFCMELAELPKLNFLQKALVTTCMMFMKKMSPSFHFNMSSSGISDNDKTNGTYETPHMAFEVDKVLDRLAITKPGETPPVLGEGIPEDPERTKARRQGKYQVDWNTNDTYTMAIWSHYIDWIEWEVVHIPGVKHFSLNKVLGDQSIFMQLYLVDKNRKEKNKHYQKDIQHVVNLEFKENPDFVRLLDKKKRDKIKKSKK